MLIKHGPMIRTRVKICGITRVRDAHSAVDSGADAIGLVFYPHSPRHVTPGQARQIAAEVAPFVSVVGLFVNAAPASISDVLDQVPLTLLQFHGHESNTDCRRFGLPFIKSVAMQPGVDLHVQAEAYPDAAGLLLDAWQPQAHGGGGVTFDWDQVPVHLPLPVILAGGLTPENVANAICQVRPYAVDVSSGVESSKGIKSADKIAAFMKGVTSCGTEKDS